MVKCDFFFKWHWETPIHSMCYVTVITHLFTLKSVNRTSVLTSPSMLSWPRSLWRWWRNTTRLKLTSEIRAREESPDSWRSVSYIFDKRTIWLLTVNIDKDTYFGVELSRNTLLYSFQTWLHINTFRFYNYLSQSCSVTYDGITPLTLQEATIWKRQKKPANISKCTRFIHEYLNNIRETFSSIYCIYSAVTLRYIEERNCVSMVPVQNKRMNTRCKQQDTRYKHIVQ